MELYFQYGNILPIVSMQIFWGAKAEFDTQDSRGSTFLSGKGERNRTKQDKIKDHISDLKPVKRQGKGNLGRKPPRLQGSSEKLSARSKEEVSVSRSALVPSPYSAAGGSSQRKRGLKSSQWEQLGQPVNSAPSNRLFSWKRPELCISLVITSKIKMQQGPIAWCF